MKSNLIIGQDRKNLNFVAKTATAADGLQRQIFVDNTATEL
jgi:hypothetical protein